MNGQMGQFLKGKEGRKNMDGWKIRSMDGQIGLMYGMGHIVNLLMDV